MKQIFLWERRGGGLFYCRFSIVVGSRLDRTFNEVMALTKELNPPWKTTIPSIFQTTFTCYGKQGPMVINGNSAENFVTTTTVNKLNLQVQKKGKPYQFTWEHDRECLIIRDQFLVSFSIGFWKEHILCNVIPMAIAHLVLGRSWLFE